MKRALLIVGIFAAIQAVFALVYFSRGGDEPGLEAERLDWQAPALSYRSADGSVGTLAQHRGEPLLLHFWATWCAPCREELPSLLAWAEDGDIAMLAVSVDESWTAVDRFLEGARPAPVVLAASKDVADAFRLQVVPETLVIDAEGKAVLGLAGARDWSSPELRRLVLREATRSSAHPSVR